MRPRKNGVQSYSAATEKSKTNKLAVTKGKSIAPGRLAFFLTSSFDYQASATDLERCSESCWRFVGEMFDVQVRTIIACALT
jgi:hypothetical protein